MDALDQGAVDRAMLALDGTPNKGKLGANAILGVSLAVARAAANACNLPLFRYLGGSTANRLPVPMFNILNGGVHANWQGTDLQEFMIAPVGAPNFAEALRWGSEIYQRAEESAQGWRLLHRRGRRGRLRAGAEEQFRRRGSDPQGHRRRGYRPGEDVVIALDPASSGFYRGWPVQPAHRGSQGRRRRDGGDVCRLGEEIPHRRARRRSGRGRLGWLETAQSRLGDKIELVGDDLFVTNVERIARGIKENVANAVLIKLNQIGTLTETIAAVKLAYQANWGAMVSHRSGETVDSFIADLTVALGTGHLKTGAPCRGERVEKYNQLMRIEESLGHQRCTPGTTHLSRLAAGGRHRGSAARTF